MSSDDRRAAARRRAWGRGPAILRFEPLEGRQLLSADSPLVTDNPVPAEVPAPAIIPLQQDAPAPDSASNPVVVGDGTPHPNDVQVTLAALANIPVDAAAPVSATTDPASTTAAQAPPVVVVPTDPKPTDGATTPATTGAIPASGAIDPATVTTQTTTAAPPVTSTPAVPAKPDLIGTTFATPLTLDWGDSFRAVGSIQNQGAAASGSFRVDVVASRVSAPGTGEVWLTSIDFPDGLAAGETRSFDVPVSLPTTPLPPGDAPPYVSVRLRIDAGNTIDETDEANNQGRGQGLDTSVITIMPHLPARLVGAAFNVSSGPLSWGDTVVVSAQVRNDALGNAPATRARIVLTPVGQLPGGSHDVTIGSLPVPALTSHQAATVTQTLALPATQPATLAGASQFYIWILMDADFQISPLVARPAPQGLGLDAAAITIAPPPSQPERHEPPARPDLTATDVRVSSDALTWGASFQVSADLHNGGRADAGPVRVRFLLTGPDGATDAAIALGDVTVRSLKADATQRITQALWLPAGLPQGLMPTGPIAGRIVVQVDPENTIDEVNEDNNTAQSAPVVLKLLSVDGTSMIVTPPPATPLAATAPATPSPATPAAPAVPLAPAPALSSPSGTAAANPTSPAAATGETPLRRVRLARHRPVAPKPKPRKHNLRLFPDGTPHPVRSARRRKS
jgi:hypothetical protein